MVENFEHESKRLPLFSYIIPFEFGVLVFPYLVQIIKNRKIIFASFWCLPLKRDGWRNSCLSRRHFVSNVISRSMVYWQVKNVARLHHFIKTVLKSCRWSDRKISCRSTDRKKNTCRYINWRILVMSAMGRVNWTI